MIMTVRVSVMCCGNNQHIVISGTVTYLLYRGCLGMSLSTSSHSVVSRRRPLCWVVSCRIISVVLCLTLLRVVY